MHGCHSGAFGHGKLETFFLPCHLLFHIIECSLWRYEAHKHFIPRKFQFCST